MKRSLRGCYEEFPSCCGAAIVHNLCVKTYDETSKGKVMPTDGEAMLAITAPEQKQEVVELKKLGFKPKGTWINSETDNKLTLWVWLPPKQNKKRKANLGRGD